MGFMRLHRFFIEERIGTNKNVTISDEDLIHQWRNVFRLHSGDEVILLDNSGFEYVSEIVSLEKSEARITVKESRANSVVPSKELFIFQSMIKRDKFEMILEKGTEIGVSHFRPVVSARSVVRELNVPRERKIIKEASEQCGRGTFPALYEIMDLKEAVSIYPDMPAIAFDPDGVKFDPCAFQDHKKMSVFIGPEGGWSDEELALFKEKNIPIYSLGTPTLRAETAAIVIAGLLLL
jgi:16S rRNA (uracil1498-N3)-methyltransferase